MRRPASDSDDVLLIVEEVFFYMRSMPRKLPDNDFLGRLSLVGRKMKRRNPLLGDTTLCGKDTICHLVKLVIGQNFYFSFTPSISCMKA